MIFIIFVLVIFQTILSYVLFNVIKQNNKLKKNKSELAESNVKISFLEKSINELNSEYKTVNEKNLKLEIEKNDYLNEIKFLKEYKAKNVELSQLLEHKDKRINELITERNNFENKFNIEKSAHSDREIQIKKYIIELLEKNKEIIDKNFEEKNRINNKNISEITSNLTENFKKITEKILHIEDNNNSTKKIVDELKNSLIIPHKAGHTSEITLENILSNSGLRKKNSLSEDGDYITQVSLKINDEFFNDNVLRPDAIVYLPNNNYLIIDSKSSSHFVELQEAIDNNNKEKEKELNQKIKERLNKHLNDLISKDYKKALYNFLNDNSSIKPTIMTIMFVQTEGIMSLIRKIDPTLEIRALQSNIPIASPLGLINILNMSKYTIHKDIQDKNIEKLKQEMFTLMDNLSLVFERTEKMGKKLYEAIGNYNDLTTTFNSNLLTRIKNIHKLGIKGKKEIPIKLSRFDLQKDIIDGELLNVDNKLIEE